MTSAHGNQPKQCEVRSWAERSAGLSQQGLLAFHSLQHIISKPACQRRSQISVSSPTVPHLKWELRRVDGELTRARDSEGTHVSACSGKVAFPPPLSAQTVLLGSRLAFLAAWRRVQLLPWQPPAYGCGPLLCRLEEA